MGLIPFPLSPIQKNYVSYTDKFFSFGGFYVGFFKEAGTMVQIKLMKAGREV